MEFSKVTVSCLISFGILCTGCAPRSAAMTEADERLFEQTMTTSTLSKNAANQNISFYSALPKDLKQALASYQDMYRYGGMHDYDYLQELGIRFLEESKDAFDPEAQLLSVYGASIAKNHKLLPILDRALASEHPQVQLAAIRALSEYHDDDASRILLKGLRSNYLEVCFETVFTLAMSKHPDSIGYIEALMNKVPEQLHFLFPMLYAILDTPQSSKALKKFFHSSDTALRVETILSAAKLNRYDLLVDIRRLAKQHDITQLEACASALGQLQDESSIKDLERLSKSPSEYVALSALQSLYRLGQREVIAEIEAYAASGNIYAIHMLRDCQGDEKVLEALSYHTNEQVRLNASLALLKKKNPLCLSEVRNILIPHDPQLLILPTQSPGKGLNAKKWALNTSSAIKKNPYLKEFSNQIRREVLMECLELPESIFLTLASEIIDAHQNDLVPHVISLVQSLKTANSVALLMEWQQKAGHPYVRAWSNLALFNLDQPGPWKDNILTWIKKQSTHPMIRIRTIVPWNRKTTLTHFDLSPEEKSQLLIESYLAIALRQEEGSLDVILSHLSNHHSKNKYALAGILIKATE